MDLMSSNLDLIEKSSQLDYGTRPVSDVIQKILSLPEDQTDIILINASTICRNICYTSYPTDDRKTIIESKNIKPVIDHVIYSLETLISIIKTCFEHKIDSSIQRYIIIYMFDYELMIPEDFYRTPSDKFTLYVEQCLKLKNSNRECFTYGEDTVVTEIYPDTSLPSYVYLNQFISNIKNRHNVLMISHHPIDYHLGSIIDNWKLITSFTGQVKSIDDLSKSVFGINEIPFNTSSHVLLGDKIDIKQSIKRGDKKKIIELAQAESWNLLSKNNFDKHLQELQIILPYNF